MEKFRAILSDIKIQHTLFAMPFAVMSAFIAAKDFPPLEELGLIIVALFFARSSAMAFNRIIDADMDALNPRTRGRALPSGKAGIKEYMVFFVVSGIGFIITCGFLNPLALKLSPAALFIVCFYSYTKRFTAYSHFFLGLALSLAPIGAWVALKEEIAFVPVFLGMAVIFWLAGLDVIYSCQDVKFDKGKNLNSIPVRFGLERGLRLSSVFHLLMIVFLFATGYLAGLSWLYYSGVVMTATLLWYEHSLVSADDLTKVNVAFFNINGIISVALMVFVIVDVLWIKG